MILTSPLNLIPPQYKLVAELLVCVALIWAGWHCRVIYDDHIRANEYQDYIKEQDKRYTDFMTAQSGLQKWLATQSQQLQTIRDNGDALQGILATKKFTVEVPNANPNSNGCPAIVLSEPARMCFMAAATGDPKAVSACEASGGYDAVPATIKLPVPKPR